MVIIAFEWKLNSALVHGIKCCPSPPIDATARVTLSSNRLKHWTLTITFFVLFYFVGFWATGQSSFVRYNYQNKPLLNDCTQPKHKVNVAIIYLNVWSQRTARNNTNSNKKNRQQMEKPHNFISFYFSLLELACEPNFTSSQNKIWVLLLLAHHKCAKRNENRHTCTFWHCRNVLEGIWNRDREWKSTKTTPEI